MAVLDNSALEHISTDTSTLVASVKYVIITPVRDEEQFIEKTINSVVTQTITPIQWIIVNDGSKDRTGEIIDSYAKEYSWILPVHRQDRGFRKSGSGVMEAFYDGYKKINEDFDFIVKLDGDLSFDRDYFESCFLEFTKNEQLGITGGVIYNPVKGRFELEKQPLFHVRGATKIYRRECWYAIGGLIKAPGWDTLDEVKANMLGWKTLSNPTLHLHQHRFTGASDGSIRNLIKNGKANYISGYHPLFMALKCFSRLFSKPLVIGSFALLYGYLESFFKKTPKVEDKELIKYLRKQQLEKILLKPTSIWR